MCDVLFARRWSVHNKRQLHDTQATSTNLTLTTTKQLSTYICNLRNSNHLTGHLHRPTARPIVGDQTAHALPLRFHVLSHQSPNPAFEHQQREHHILHFAKMMQMQMLLAQLLGQSKLLESMEEGARTEKQSVHARSLWRHFSLLLKTPEAAADVRLLSAFELLNKVICGIEQLGPMTEDYLRKLFHYGQQALVIIEAVVGQRYGGRKINFAPLAALEPAKTKSKSQKDKRAIRRALILGQCNYLLNLANDDVERMEVAFTILRVCSGDVMEIKPKGEAKVRLPKIGTLKGGKIDKNWEVEMHHYCSYAVMALGQCLGHRFMRWPVEIQGQVVPETGDGKKELLKDWVAVEDSCEDCQTQ